MVKLPLERQGEVVQGEFRFSAPSPTPTNSLSGPHPSSPFTQISIKDEQLHPDGTWSVEEEELEKVFGLFGQDGIAQDKIPSYFIVK
jgi:hypothetical protein